MTEAVPCRVCGSEATSRRFPRSDIPVRHCNECGVDFRPGEVTKTDLEKLYDKDYYLNTWPGSLGKFFEDFDPDKNHKTKFFKKQLSEFAGILGGKGKLLDVGCANGVFPWIAEQEGWQAEGVEISPFAVAWGRDQFGVTIHQGDMNVIDPDEQYDLITFWDTLEHLPDPASSLRRAYDRLKPGGIVAVLTPDTHSLVNKLVHGAYHLFPKKAGGLLKKLYHEDHLTFFNRNALCLALVEEGFFIHWIITCDEDPRDTETSGLAVVGVYLIHFAASIIQRRHELLVWARKPKEGPP